MKKSKLEHIKKSGFKTPKEYFNTLEDTVFDKMASEKFSKKEGFKSPEGYFNSVGLAGWVFTGSILKKDTIPDKQMGVYNSLVPVFKILDKAFTPFFGLSTIVVGVK